MDLGDEILARAREAAGRTHPVPPTAAELESLRVEAMEQLALIPEPPAYKRASDPAREHAKERLADAEALLERALLFRKAAEGGANEAQSRSIARALEAQVVALAAIAQGQIARGEDLVGKARAEARAVSELAAAFHRVGAERRAVWDRANAASRFDPHEPEHLEVMLACPQNGCRKSGRYALSTRSPTHRFTCASCRQTFLGYFGEVRSVETRRQGNAARYELQVDEVGGHDRRIAFDDASGGALPVAPRDLVALLYAAGTTLNAVENLSSGRVLWIKHKDNCFLATAAYGEGAPELATFRAFRDEVLAPRAWGRAAISAYYAVGPRLAARFEKSPRGKAALRFALERVRARLHSRR